ncbi:hypothetical protein [Streptomyces kronopolitis]|uniref:hypothetical protein n=1 Tax=Streptomyces kronopolitis TaxID=1612435 RepID=UPI001E2C9C18|nr:hypothetical protein [Streptomyces kronopolitis]
MNEYDSTLAVHAQYRAVVVPSDLPLDFVQWAICEVLGISPVSFKSVIFWMLIFVFRHVGLFAQTLAMSLYVLIVLLVNSSDIPLAW